MSRLASRATTQEIVRAVLAADSACPTSAFDQDGLLVTAAEERPERRRYPWAAKPLSVMTMGRGVVVSCHPTWIAALHQILDGRSQETLFSAQTMTELAHLVAHANEVLVGPTLSHVCAHEYFRTAVEPRDVHVRVVEGPDVLELYHYPGFEHALSYDPDHVRPDVAAAVARRAERIIGIAGMSADCEDLWQIGVTVVADERGRGIGRALVSRLSELAFQRHRVPFYAADIGNVRSQALAASLGYWPAWVQLVARER